MAAIPIFPAGRIPCSSTTAIPSCRAARIDELIAIAGKCDGVRCDMAMLLLPEIFQRTWGITPEPFWPKATAAVHAKYPDFTFMAEVYWDLEWTLQQQGFAYCYDKRLYDRLKEGHAGPIRDHLLAGLDYQDKLARFLENHDEPRAAAEFPWPQHQAAAIITFLSPGLRFFHRGPVRGRTGAGADPSLPRSGRADEPGNRGLLCEAAAGSKDRVPFATASGRRSSRSRPGPATGPRTASSPTPGPARTAADMSSSSITPATRGNAGCRCHFRNCATGRCA